ncbi:Yae1 family protein [Phanerochaete sordida]|uniref:Yae1 family protein n=1 Tax=Phanerochaete sordida TaxID=48140 RepID=A0A9P3GJ33_9APHY|nr:Yae1 family protein [Phanerochaete sordida]
MDFDLEELVHVEQTFYEEGYRDGHAHGRIHGLIEGRALGREKGFEMWEELGFYEGFARMWASILEKQGRRDDRASSNIKHLLDLIAQFPKINPSASEQTELDIPKLFRQIRSRYKALCATLGVRPTLRAGGPAGSADGVEDPANSPTGDASGEVKNVWKIDNKPAPRANNDLSF